ncbi:MAG: hypothetical protein IPK21_10485 [Haliscomenobacter sp.]|nr:hypothetical protein [Haliscomenobacter sp.]
MQDRDHQDQLADLGWDQMRQLLDKEMPERRRALFWWWLLPVFLAVAGERYLRGMLLAPSARLPFFRFNNQNPMRCPEHLPRKRIRKWKPSLLPDKKYMRARLPLVQAPGKHPTD